jgi:hypothetical protein
MLRHLTLATAAAAAAVAFSLPLQAGMSPAPGLSGDHESAVIRVHKTGKKHTHEPTPPAATYLGDTCKPRVIETGAARPSETWARSVALKAWKRKAVLAYGELYTDIANAKDIVWRCTKAGVSGLTTRCEVAATPCRAAPVQ